MHNITSEAIFGYNTLYQSSSELAGFSEIFEDPVLTRDNLAATQGLSPEEIEIVAVTGIGEAALRFVIVEETGDTTPRTDMIIFLRGNVGNFLYQIYMSDQPPSASIVDLARLWDQRLIAEGR
jgi:hypothetical protein